VTETKDSNSLHKYSVEVVPPTVLATPNLVARAESDEIHWWQPSWRDSLRFVGYRWIFLTPAVGLVALSVWFWFDRGIGYLILFLGIKLLIVTTAIALSLAGYVVRRAVKAKTEPFCIFCGYNLTCLPDHYRCPECGRPYTWDLVAEYRRDPRWFVERWQAGRELPEPTRPFASGKVRRRNRAKDGTE